MKRVRCAGWVLGATLGCASVGAVQQNQQSPPPGQQTAPENKNKATPPNEGPRWDPLRAAKDMEVGNFYMKRGKIDAAIERFRDAVLSRPNFALPHKRLGEAYEKKGDKLTASKEYEKYLEILPHAPDEKEIRKRIEKLSQETTKENEDRR